MLSSRDFYDEMNHHENYTKPDFEITQKIFWKAMIKLAIISCKLLHNIRTNIVKFMDHFKIEKVKPRERTDQVEESKK